MPQVKLFGTDTENDDEGEYWKQFKTGRQVKRWQNVDQSLALLRSHGIEYETLNADIAHYRVRGWSFWPTTGKYFDPKSGISGRGVQNLINQLKK